jgi:predicted N-formylglutamate amidohydrolase
VANSLSQNLSIRDPEIFNSLNSSSECNILLIADHGGMYVPESMRQLGLSDGDLKRHIAMDLGAPMLLKGLSSKLNCTALIANYTRLLIDLNRPLAGPQSLTRISDNTEITGNINVASSEYLQRAKLFYWPYHNAIASRLAQIKWSGKTPILISLHTFTPILGKEKRPWDIGVMSADDKRLSSIVLKLLCDKSRDIVVGDNQPYSGAKYCHTVRMQAELLGYPYVQLEVRQDLLDTDDKVALWTDYLVKVLSTATKRF